MAGEGRVNKGQGCRLRVGGGKFNHMFITDKQMSRFHIVERQYNIEVKSRGSGAKLPEFDFY